ncbi:MAG: hypothetical protein H6R21_3281, partial [Proteobacteria bacterium]|nr:hypothetical protein [Pseudomonadota bacterium]
MSTIPSELPAGAAAAPVRRLRLPQRVRGPLLAIAFPLAL